MIAMALMLIMTLQLQIVFGHTRKLYLSADAMAQVYSNARAALDQIERDVANAVKTDQMEFFNDNRTASNGIGHWQQGEESAFLATKWVPAQRYVNAMSFRQPKEYTPKDQHKVGGPYRHDGMYFRTFTTVNGQPREALVEYRLWLGANPADPRPRPVLQRIVTAPRLDARGMPMYDPQGNPILERQEPQDMCYFVQEFKIELYIPDRRPPGGDLRGRKAGRFYSPKEAIMKGPTEFETKAPGLPNLAPGGDEVVIQCLDGKNEPDAQAIFDAADGLLHLRNGDRVPRLGPGDKMYLRSKVYPPNVVIDFLNSYVTVKEIITKNAGETTIAFEEEDRMKQLATSGSITSLEMAYRGGWLPQAVRVQMKVKDARSDEIRTITRTFQLLKS